MHTLWPTEIPTYTWPTPATCQAHTTEDLWWPVAATLFAKTSTSEIIDWSVVGRKVQPQWRVEPRPTMGDGERLSGKHSSIFLRTTSLAWQWRSAQAMCYTWKQETRVLRLSAPARGNALSHPTHLTTCPAHSQESATTDRSVHPGQHHIHRSGRTHTHARTTRVPSSHNLTSAIASAIIIPTLVLHSVTNCCPVSPFLAHTTRAGRHQTSLLSPLRPAGPRTGRSACGSRAQVCQGGTLSSHNLCNLVCHSCADVSVCDDVGACV